MLPYILRLLANVELSPVKNQITQSFVVPSTFGYQAKSGVIKLTFFCRKK